MSKKKLKPSSPVVRNVPSPDIIIPLLQGATAALFVATVVFSGESLVRYGNGHLLTVLWFLLATACAVWNLWGKKRSAAENGRLVEDIAVVLFFLGIAISSGVHFLPGNGCVRYGLNAFFTWMELAAVFYVFRTIFDGPTVKKAFLAILIAIAVGESVLGFYQYAVERLRLIEQYESDKESNLAVLGIVPGSPEQTLFENRINNREPLGTYPLTNTLAGVLAPALVLLIGMMVLSRSAKRRPLMIGGGLLALVLGTCLLLTQSRTGCLAAMCGLLLLAWERSRNYFSRRTIGIVLLVAVLLFGSVGVAISVGGLDFDLLAGAKKSLGYRIEYWESTAKMIREHPWFGCGAGNYQHVYTQYKLPDTSEEIADPHNFVMEIASNFGIPTLIGFAIFLVVLFFQKNPAEATDEKPRNYLPLLTGSLLGFAVVFLCTQTTEIPLDWKTTAILAASFAVSVCTTFPLASLRNENLDFLLKATLVVILVNLSAAGGIAYPNVAASLWLLAAMLSPNGIGDRNRPPMIPIVFGLVFFFLAFACYNFSFLPALRSSADQARAMLQNTSESQIQWLQKAVQADPFSVESRLALTQARFNLYEAIGDGKTLQAALSDQDATARLAPFSASIRKMLGETMMHAYQRRADRTVLEAALRRFEEAVELYPNHAKNHAALAVALEKAGQRDRALREANIAIELDDTMPHLDQKLGESLRQELESLLETASK